MVEKHFPRRLNADFPGDHEDSAQRELPTGTMSRVQPHHIPYVYNFHTRESHTTQDQKPTYPGLGPPRTVILEFMFTVYPRRTTSTNYQMLTYRYEKCTASTTGEAVPLPPVWIQHQVLVSEGIGGFWSLFLCIRIEGRRCLQYVKHW